MWIFIFLSSQGGKTMKKTVHIISIILIISSTLLFLNCHPTDAPVMVNPQPNELPYGYDMKFFGSPLKATSEENHLSIELHYTRRSERIQKFIEFKKQDRIKLNTPPVQVVAYGQINAPYKVKLIDADPGMVFVIMTIDCYVRPGRDAYTYKVPGGEVAVYKGDIVTAVYNYGGKVNKYASIKKRKKYPIYKITQQDIILYDKKNNYYPITAFAAPKTHKEIFGYFFEYKLYSFVNAWKPWLVIDTRQKYVVIGSDVIVNLAFKVPKDAELDHLKIGEAQLSIPSS
jgi:hypothetical protein